MVFDTYLKSFCAGVPAMVTIKDAQRKTTTVTGLVRHYDKTI